MTIQVAKEGQATVSIEDASGGVGNAIVRMLHDGRPVVNARTTADGTFTTDGIEQGNHTLITFKEGYLRNRTTLTVDGEVTQLMAIERGSVLVTFSVTDDHFDPPRAVTGANVSILGVADVTIQGTGSVTVSLPVNDAYDVTINKPGYERVTRELTVRESETALNASIQREPAVLVQADSDRVVVSEPVRVTVTDEYDNPVSGSSVSVDNSSVGETDGHGEIRVPVESAGNVTISAESEGGEDTVTVGGVQPDGADTPTAMATATATPSTDNPTETSTGFGPGFGVTGALVALLLGAIAARRRE